MRVLDYIRLHFLSPPSSEGARGVANTLKTKKYLFAIFRYIRTQISVCTSSRLPLRREGDRDLLAVEGEILHYPGRSFPRLPLRREGDRVSGGGRDFTSEILQ